MLHFFRKIRRDLLADSQFFKYLKYAIGEIVLVVLGILIALFINNKNEKRKEGERFNQTLAEIKEELDFNIGMTRFYIEEFTAFDSAYLKLFIDSVKIKDYYFYNHILFGFHPDWPVRNYAFDKLDQTLSLNEQQNSILDDLRYLYSVIQNGIKLSEFDFLENREQYGKRMKIYDWYTSWKSSNFDDERIIDFFTNDPEYLKMAMENFYSYSVFNSGLQEYDERGILVQKKIVDYLNSIDFKHSDSLQFDYDPNDFKHYTGQYIATWCSQKNFIFDDSITVRMEKDKLIYTGYRTDGPDIVKKIIPINKYSFRDNIVGGFYHLEFDENGEVEGIRFSLGPTWVYTMKKVR